MNIRFLLLMLAIVLPTQNYAQEITNVASEKQFPSPIGYVSDFEQVFTRDEVLGLNLVLRDFETKTTNQLAVVSVVSIAPYTDFARYSLELANEWKVGQKDKDNGLVIVFSTKLREIRITTGKGTAKTLSDADCKEIIDNLILPEFRKGNYHSGISNGINAIMSKWKFPLENKK